MLATELALKNIPVRVNSIAPGVYESEMTFDTISGREEMAKVAQSLLPVPAGRPGTYVYPRCADPCVHLTRILKAWRDCWYSYLSIIPCGVLYQWPRDCRRWKLHWCQSVYGLMFYDDFFSLVGRGLYLLRING